MRFLRPSYRSRWRVLTVLLAASAVVPFVAAPAQAANPHFVNASAVLDHPQLIQPQPTEVTIAWDGLLTVPFHMAGLGHNQGITVEATTSGSAVGYMVQCTVNDTDWGWSGDVNALNEVAHFTSDRNGQVKGAIELRNADLYFHLFGIAGPCHADVFIWYPDVKLTMGNVVRDLGSVSGEYEYQLAS